VTLKTGIDKLKVEIEELEAAIGRADPAPMIINIVNDPERRRAGPDEAVVGGQVYLRGADEDRTAFDRRLIAAANACGQTVICVSLADFGPGPFLDDLRIGDLDQKVTIEIDSAVEPGTG
jgi:hypothetical protein